MNIASLPLFPEIKLDTTIRANALHHDYSSGNALASPDSHTFKWTCALCDTPHLLPNPTTPPRKTLKKQVSDKMLNHLSPVLPYIIADAPYVPRPPRTEFTFICFSCFDESMKSLAVHAEDLEAELARCAEVLRRFEEEMQSTTDHALENRHEECITAFEARKKQAIENVTNRRIQVLHDRLMEAHAAGHETKEAVLQDLRDNARSKSMDGLIKHLLAATSVEDYADFASTLASAFVNSSPQSPYLLDLAAPETVLQTEEEVECLNLYKAYDDHRKGLSKQIKHVGIPALFSQVFVNGVRMDLNKAAELHIVPATVPMDDPAAIRWKRLTEKMPRLKNWAQN